MTEKRTFILSHDAARQNALEAVRNAPHGFAVVIREVTRNLDQNAAMWPILDAFAKQKQWPVNGVLEWITPEEWKDILTAAFKKEMIRISPGLDGGMVMLGIRTSRLGKKVFSGWLDFLNATAIEHDINLDIKS